MKKLTLTLLLGVISLTAWANDSDDNCGFILPAGYQFAETFDPCDGDGELVPIVPMVNVGYANKSGQVIIAPTFTEAHPFSEGVGLVKHDDKYGYVNDQGEFVIKATFDDAWSFSEGRAKIEHAGKYGFIDKAGKVVIKPIYDETGNWFEDGLVAVSKDDKYGFIDKTGKVKIPLEYDSISDFSEGLALVAKQVGTDDDGDEVYKYGFINKSGKITINLEYDYATSFDNGIATVIKGDKAYTIDKKGKIVEQAIE